MEYSTCSWYNNECFKSLTKIACVKIPTLWRVFETFPYSLLYFQEVWRVAYVWVGFCVLLLIALRCSSSAAISLFSLLETFHPSTVIYSHLQSARFIRKFVSFAQDTCVLRYTKHCIIFHSEFCWSSSHFDWYECSCAMRISTADPKPFPDPLQISVIKQWKLVWAVPWPSLLLQEIKDNPEAVGALCCHKAFSRWSRCPSRLVFIPYELVLRVSALTVPFSLPLCVVFSLLVSPVCLLYSCIPAIQSVHHPSFILPSEKTPC